MAELKTKKNKASVTDFMNGISDPQKRKDCRAIARMMREATGKRAKMWGSSIVGYDSYDYAYASGQSGEWPITGFSPRARNISIYIMSGFKGQAALLKKLGKHKTGASCLYIKRLDDVDEKVLSRLIRDSVKAMRRKYHK